MRTQVFTYKGNLGILSDAVDAEGLLNEPLKPGQLGFVLDAACVDFQPAAIDLMKTLRKTVDDLGDVDTFKTDDGRIVFSWLGGPKHSLLHDIMDDYTVPRTADFSLLTSVEFDTPVEFMDFIDRVVEEE